MLGVAVVFPFIFVDWMKREMSKKMVKMQSMLFTCFSLKSSKLLDTLDFSVLSLTIIRPLMDV